MDRMKMFDIVKKIMEDTGAYSVLKNELLQYQVHDLLYYYSEIKPEFKEEYFNAMLDELRRINLSEEEKKMLCEKESDFQEILEKIQKKNSAQTLSLSFAKPPLCGMPPLS